MIFDPVYMLLMVFIMLMLGLASKNVQATFTKFSKVPIRNRMTGAQAARYILDSNGLQNVAIERVSGSLTDHYDPRSKVLRLSEPVYDSMSISAVGVAAHEAGHAIQEKTGYAPLMLRQGVIPLASFGSQFGLFLVIIGFFVGAFLSWIGVALYGIAVLASVITLPVEFNASSRALAQLTQYGIVSSEEHTGTKKVLNAAALTYVAAALGAILTLLYYVMLLMGNRD
ncbi:MAG: zinc metallopeptidase [Candidatus Omnitrophica bacterium]|nr:zinc metallopeptidase [Candidatus Omnitrophota bacterium]